MSRNRLIVASLGIMILLVAGCGTMTGKVQEQPQPVIGAPQPIRLFKQVTTPRLSAIGFSDLLHGWAAGAGIILATTDGGRQWHQQYSGQEVFSQIQALSPSDAFVVGQHTLVGTRDGGRHWNTLGEPAEPLSSIDFVTPTMGFGLAGPPGSLNLSLVRTLDGGKTWNPVPSGMKTSSICFVSPQRGWAYTGDGVAETTNGGTTWQKLPGIVPSSAASGIIGGAVGCAAPATVYVQLDGWASMSQQPYSLWGSSDGGETWRPLMATQTGAVGPPPGNLQGVPLAPGSSPGPFVVDNTHTVVAVGLCTACGGRTNLVGTARFGWTDNGGQTWHDSTKRLLNGLPTGGGPIGISFPTSQTGWLVASPLQGETELLVTHNGGQSWQTQWRFQASKPLQAISFVNRSLGYGLGTVTDPLTVLRTTDGGRKWQKVGRLQANHLFYGGWDSLVFMDRRQGVAVSPDGVYQTSSDGGRHWHRSSLPASINNQVAFANPRDGCVQQNPGPAYLWTVNGGKTWHRGTPSVAHDPIACAAGLASAAWRSSLNQISKQLTQPGEMWSMVAVRGSNGWISVQWGRQYLLHSSNFGRTWVRYVWPTNVPGIWRYSFINGKEGWGITPNGKLFHTTDGGRDWTQVQ